MERVIFDHLLTEEELNNLPKHSAEYEHWQRYKWVAGKFEGKKVLDISCGTGYGSELLALNKNEVTGIDISAEAVEYAQKHFKKPKFHVGNAEDLSIYADNSIDGVVSFETIEHLDHPEKFISEVRRVLKRGGKFYGSVPRELDNPQFREHNIFHKNFYGFLPDVIQLLSQFMDIRVISQEYDILDHYSDPQTRYFVFEAIKRKNPVFVVIPTYNSQDVFERCYQGFLKAGYPYILTAIDNNSKDKTYLKRPGVSVVYNDKNFKFTHAVNQGLKLNKEDYVLLLNPDCSGFLEQGWLEKMVRELKENKADVAGAILKFPDGTIQHAGAYGHGKHTGYKEEDKGQFDMVSEVEWVTGACMLIKKELTKIKWNEKKYPHYESDREWCHKIRFKGYKIIRSSAKLSHLEGRSSSEPVKKHEGKLRILWHSNSAWTPTGYGVQTNNFTEALHKEGYPIAISSYYGLEGGILKMGGIPCYPKMMTVWGEDSIVAHAKDFQADIVITLMDIWPLQTAFKDQVRWVAVVPVDHDEVPPPVLVRAKDAWKVVAYSKYGQEAFKRKGIEATYIPHCVDTKIFKPLDKKKSRETFAIPEDAYVVGMVAQNKSSSPSRKSFQQALEAFRDFAKDKPHAKLYLHTIIGTEQGGMNILEYCEFLGIADRLIYTLPYNYLYKFGPEDLAKLYSSFDVLLNPSTGEGFGVPLVESQACGTPVIAGNWTSMPELIGAGYLVEWSEKWFTPLAAYQFFPKVESIVIALELCYKSDKEKMKKEAVEFAKQYDVDKVVKDYFVPFLESI